jgi:hypothetical protein
LSRSRQPTPLFDLEGIDSLVEMLRHRRPHGTKAAVNFGRRFLAPLMGPADVDGNYFLRVGVSPIMFAAHYDTVHFQGGVQDVAVHDGWAFLPAGSKSNCLGADCTTGVWLILEMIRAGVPGNYAIFAGEEVGCLGSRAFSDNRREDLEGVDFVLSFDRRGYDSIITHQMGTRTASGAFADSLESILEMGFAADPTGSYTDSNEFAHLVSECSNLSVGYFSQHTNKETQDLHHAARLRNRLVDAEWSRLVAARDPMAWEPADTWADFAKGKPVAVTKTKAKTKKAKARNLAADGLGWDYGYQRDSLPDLRRMVRDYPDAVAALLEDLGCTSSDVREYANLHDVPF